LQASPESLVSTIRTVGAPAPNRAGHVFPHVARTDTDTSPFNGLELDAATTSKLAGHANPHVTMRVYADDFRKAGERNAAVLARAAEKGFGT